jgi:hypothetical protein
MSAKERLDQHDKQMAAIRNLMELGMRIVNKNSRDIRALIAAQRRAAEAQKRTEQSLRAFIERTGGTNGHTKRKVDLQ